MQTVAYTYIHTHVPWPHHAYWRRQTLITKRKAYEYTSLKDCELGIPNSKSHLTASQLRNGAQNVKTQSLAMKKAVFTRWVLYLVVYNTFHPSIDKQRDTNYKTRINGRRKCTGTPMNMHLKKKRQEKESSVLSHVRRSVDTRAWARDVSPVATYKKDFNVKVHGKITVCHISKPSTIYKKPNIITHTSHTVDTRNLVRIQHLAQHQKGILPS